MKKLLFFFLLLFTTNCFAQTSIKSISKVSGKQIYKTTLGTDEVIIGNEAKPDVFEPTVCFTKWNKENSLTIKPSPELALELGNSPTLVDGKVSVSGSKIGWYANPDSDNSNNFKFGLILYEKPTTNTWSFQLEGWEDYNFYKIPEVNSHGEKIPEDITGSYNVYSKTKINNQYCEGGFIRVYRAKFIDADGKFVYGTTEIEDGILTETCPQGFLDTAKYPVRSNATIGYTTDDHGDCTTVAQNRYGLQKLTAVAGDYSSITVYVTGSTIAFKGVIYDDDGAGGIPGTLMGVTPAGSAGGAAYVTVTFSTPVTLTAGNFWFGIVSNGNINFYDDTGGANSTSFYSDTVAGVYATPQATFDAGINYQNGYHWNIYATYTAGGGGSVIKTKEGLAIASVKTVDGLAIGSVKTIDGAAAQ